MRIWKQNLLVIGILIAIIAAAQSVSAEADGSDDLWHWKATGTSAAWEAYATGGKGYIDITSIDYSITGSEATLTMTLSENIQDSQTVIYYIHLVTGSDYYIAYYVNGVGVVAGSGGQLAGYYAMLESPVSEKTFTATFTINDPSATYSVRGYAQELTSVGDETAEWWGDWAPDTYFHDYSGYTPEDGNGDETGDGTEDGETGGDGTSDTNKGTPGFEIITLIAAISIAIILLRKKK